MAPRRDPNTLDLWRDYIPPVVAPRYPEERVRAVTLAARIARGVSETLRDCNIGREDVAERMSEYLGAEISVNMLNAYASEARAEHQISFLRLVALVRVTGDTRLLQLVAEEVGCFVAEQKYLTWVEVGMDADRREQARQLAEDAEREFDMKLRLARRGGGK